MVDGWFRFALVSVVLVGGCAQPRIHTRPVAEPPPPLSLERTELELGELARRLEIAAADGLSADECAALQQDYQALADASGGLPEPRFGLAVVAERCGDVSRAEAVYRELAERDHGPALINLGAIVWQRGELDQAITVFERAVALAPPRATTAITARNNLAGALLERYRSSRSTADFDAAERAAQQVLALDSGNASAYENLARLYYERGHVEGPSFRLLAELVVTQGQRVLERDGRRSADLDNLHGLIWLEEGEPALAIRAFARAVELDPDHVDARRNLALLALRFRGYELAEQTLVAVLDHPEVAGDVEVWLALGVARRGRRDFDGAAAAYRQALALAPDDPRARFNLGVLAQDHRVWDIESSAEQIALAHEARDQFERFVATAGSAPTWREAVGDARDRIVIAEDTVAVIEDMSGRGCVLEPIAELDPAEEQARRQKLLEMEQEAVRLGAPAAEPSPSPPLPAEEIERRLQLEAEAEAIAPNEA